MRPAMMVFPVVLLLASLTTAAEPGPAVELPRRMGPLQRVGDVRRYDTPDMGYSFRFEAQSILADVYFYDEGQQDLGTGKLDDRTARHFRDVEEAIAHFAKEGRYRDVVRRDKGKIKFKIGDRKLPAHYAEFEYTHADRPGRSVSIAVLTTWRDQYVKVRFTFSADREEEGQDAFDAFLADLGKALGEAR